MRGQQGLRVVLILSGNAGEFPDVPQEVRRIQIEDAHRANELGRNGI